MDGSFKGGAAIAARRQRPVQVPEKLPALKSIKVLDQLRERIRLLHYSRRTEDAYVHWCRAFIRFHGLRHPADLGQAEVEAFLNWLASERDVSASTHKQAISALLFFYTKVLQIQLPWMAEMGRPRVHRRLPVVLTQQEVAAVLRHLDGVHRLFAELLYGTGMRLTEGLQLRVKDVDFAHRTLIVRAGKGGKDRLLMLPQSLAPGLREQLARAHDVWLADGSEGRSGVDLPDALARKYPRAASSWPWFWVFPQDHHSTDPRTGVVRRHHMYDQTFQRAFKRAVPVSSTSTDRRVGSAACVRAVCSANRPRHRPLAEPVFPPLSRPEQRPQGADSKQAAR